jgi:hypothetical protein
MVTTLQKVKAEIKKQNASWIAEDTESGKLTDEEKRGHLGLRVDEDILRMTYAIPRPDIALSLIFVLEKVQEVLDELRSKRGTRENR